MAIAAGDLLFYVPDGTSPFDGVIARFTGGPYSHVAVALGDGSVVAALGGPRGGVVHYAQGRPSLILATGQRCAALGAGETWLRAEIGHPYSYADVVDAAAALIWDQLQPSVSWGPFSVRVPLPQLSAIVQSGAFDCSSLAARFLIDSGMAGLPAAIRANPDICSPNSLARAIAAAL